MEENILIPSGWRYSPSWLKPNEFTLHSDMKGFEGGRYRIEVKKLKRKVEGKIYKVAIFYTPYNPLYIRYKGRVNNLKELEEAIKSVNKDLVDPKRL